MSTALEHKMELNSNSNGHAVPGVTEKHPKTSPERLAIIPVRHVEIPASRSELVALKELIEASTRTVLEQVNANQESLTAVVAELPGLIVREISNARNDRHLEALVRTLIDLRAFPKHLAHGKYVADRANILSTLIENDGDITELNPPHGAEFDPTLHKVVGEHPTNKKDLIGRVQRTVRIGVRRGNVRYKNHFAEIVRYVPIDKPSAK